MTITRMAGPRLKIVTLGLEEQVLAMRDEGRMEQAEMLDVLNERLALEQAEKDPGKDPPTVSQPALSRYLATLDKATTGSAHAPTVARKNAQLVGSLAGDVKQLHDRLGEWVVEAEAEVIPFFDKDGAPVFDKDTGELLGRPNWQARVATARELRESLKFIADLLERIYDAQQVEAFQAVVMRAIHRADPETARSIQEELRGEQSIRRAMLLGEPTPTP